MADQISNSGKKGYCMLYIFLFFFFVIVTCIYLYKSNGAGLN